MSVGITRVRGIRLEEFIGFVMVGDSSNRSSRVEVRSFEIPIDDDDNNKRSVGIKLHQELWSSRVIVDA